MGLLLGLLTGTAAAQPYAGDGGFGRPWQVAGPGIAPTIAVAAGEGFDSGNAEVVWADSDGVWRRELHDPAAADGGAAPHNVSGPGSIRGVAATVAAGEPAIAWLQRDLRTGNTIHSLNWRGREYLLFEAGQEVGLQLGSAAGRPWVFAARRFDGRAHLQLLSFADDGELAPPLSVYSTTMAVRGVTAWGADAVTGLPSFIGWLEGETSAGLLGLDAEWSAYVLALTAAGEPLGAPLELGMADVLDERQRVVLGPPAATGVTATGAPAARALWPGVDGTLQLSTITSKGADLAAGVELEVAATLDLGEGGRPIAVTGEGIYWHREQFIRRAKTGPAQGANAGGLPVTDALSVAWSPVVIAAAELAMSPYRGAAGPSADDDGAVTTIVWYGRTQGGAVEAYASDDSAPFRPTIADRLAALMGWSPWSPWQQGFGQLLTSVLVGVITVMVLAPLMFALSLLLARFGFARQRPLTTGVGLGVATPVLVALIVGWRFPASGLTQIGDRSVVVAVITLLLGAVVAYLLNRRADREAQLGILVTSLTVVLVGFTCWAFTEYRTWAPVVGLD